MAAYSGPAYAVSSLERPGKPSAFEMITDYASVSYQTLGAALGIAGAIEAVMAAAAGSPASLVTKASIVLLPIAAFQFGTYLRERMDKQDADFDAFFEKAQRLIPLLAVQHAIELHLKANPKSKLLDNSSILGIRMTEGRNSSALWTAAYKRWWQTLKVELAAIKKDARPSIMPMNHPLTIHNSYLYKTCQKEGWKAADDIEDVRDEKQLWKAFVMRRFLAIRFEFLGYLRMAEAGQ